MPQAALPHPLTIGTKTGNTNDTVTCIIPRTIPAGNGYRIRVVSSSPAHTSFDNGQNIRIKGFAANRTISSNSPICEPDTVRLFSGTSTAGVSFSWSGPNSFSANTQNTKTGKSTAATHSGQYIVTMTTNEG